MNYEQYIVRLAKISGALFILDFVIYAIYLYFN